MFRSGLVRMSLLLACVVSLSAAGVRAADNPKDPKVVSVALAKAIAAEDLKAIHQLCTGTAEQFQTVETMATALGSIRKFKSACDKQFGPANSLSKNLAGMPDLVAEAKKETFKSEGDVATAVNKDKPDEKHPMKLKLVDGEWKVDLASMGDEVATQAAVMASVAKVFKEGADDINAGKYGTAEEAAAAIFPKLQAAQQGAKKQ